MKLHEFSERHYPCWMILQRKKGSPFRSKMIDQMNKPQMKSVIFLLRQFLKGHIPVSDKEYKELEQDKAFIQELISSKVRKRRKKNILKKRGGFIFPALISAAASLLGPLASSIVKAVAHKKK